MIISHTKLKSRDNSGAVLSRCIKLLGGFQKKNSYTGDIILVNICQFKKKPRIKKKKLYLGIVLRTKESIYRYTGFNIKYDSNYILHVTKDKVPIATRILGSIPKELRYKNFIKIVSMCKKII
jgi:large subunit ribosomal protein L14